MRKKRRRPSQLGSLLISVSHIHCTHTQTKTSRIQVGVTHKFHKYKRHYFYLPFCGQHRDLAPVCPPCAFILSTPRLLSRAKLLPSHSDTSTHTLIQRECEELCCRSISSKWRNCATHTWNYTASQAMEACQLHEPATSNDDRERESRDI